MYKVTIFTIITLFISFTSQAAKYRCSIENGQSPYELGVPAAYNHTKYTPDFSSELLIKTEAAYTSFFSPKPPFLASPKFVSYHLIGVDSLINGYYSEPDVSVDSRWYRSDDLKFLWTGRSQQYRRGLDHSYNGIGRVWNRGHWAMSDHAQRISAQASCNTYQFWNASPQAKDLNQGPWRALENYTAALSNMYGQVWIITGPIFDEGTDIGFIGDDGDVPVAVPHALFKVILREVDGQLEQRAFIFEQAYTSSDGEAPKPIGKWVNCNKAKDTYTYDHEGYLVSLEKLSDRTGLFFSHLFSNLELKEQHSSIWSVGNKYWDRKTQCGAIPSGD
ncbi:hypothetical protein F9L16_13205 [Agarivorans sp. B2Z047]|uniref:DNA/RNA non-specific endonuclease n=1 Tax=Agarivorans sp. B2Z047 TaxID=2652721 RepID=UPI00128C9920|nr:DNA/RNA non-specific endonuclease [Agarivorans sp. B2Z047]MPW29946.1 hypothetical protein [Agarivorans sp. B2Z047]UQN43516.1 DNA/RNA non-specific endonuclease [Agarivorans sp. B2Z047]